MCETSDGGVGEDEREEDDADDAVDGEEGGVQAAQVAGADERVLIGKEGGDGGDAQPVRNADGEPRPRNREQTNRREVAGTRARKGSANAEPRRRGMQALLPVDPDVEERVEEVEPRDPDRHRRAERPRLPR